MKIPRIDIGVLVLDAFDGYPRVDGKITIPFIDGRKMVLQGVLTDLDKTDEMQVASIIVKDDEVILTPGGFERGRGMAPWRLNVWKATDIPDVERHAVILLGVFCKNEIDYALLLFESETYLFLTEVESAKSGRIEA